MNNKSRQAINEVLTRGVEQILPDKTGLAALMQKRKIRLYNGIDPTGPNLHLGHSVVLRKLRDFQELGHEAILLVGSFTAQIGDPTDKEATRKPLTPMQVETNMATYEEQASKILDFSKVKLVYNADWLANLSIEKTIELASHVTAQQIIERDMFQKRLKEDKPLHLHEFFYPLVQGYDSVHLNVDLEIGATDQLFNMLVGRKLQKIYNQKEKFVMTLPLLLGLDGQKMRKSLGNTVNLTDPPGEMYSKLMSLQDALIGQYFELCTDLPEADVKELTREAKKKPMDVKKRLAHEITKMYHGKDEADKAAKEFEQTIQRGEQPKNPPTVLLEHLTSTPISGATVSQIAMGTALVSSASDARRIIEQGGFELDGKRITDPMKKVKLQGGETVKIGKRGYRRIKASKK